MKCRADWESVRFLKQIMWECVGVRGSTEDRAQIVHSQFFLGPLEKNDLKDMKVQKVSYHQKNNWGNPPYLDASPGKITTHGDFAKHRASLRGDLGPFHSLQARDNEGDDSKTPTV